MDCDKKPVGAIRPVQMGSILQSTALSFLAAGLVLSSCINGNLSMTRDSKGCLNTSSGNTQSDCQDDLKILNSSEIAFEKPQVITLSMTKKIAKIGFFVSQASESCDDGTEISSEIDKNSGAYLLNLPEGKFFVCIKGWNAAGQEIIKRTTSIRVILTPPVLVGKSLETLDTSLRAGFFKGELKFVPEVDGKTEQYSVYFGSNSSTILSSASSAIKSTSDLDKGTIQIESEIAIPHGATHFLVFSENRHGRSTTSISKILDDRYPKITRIDTLNFPSQPTWYQATGLLAYTDDLWFSVFGNNTSPKMNTQATPSVLTHFSGNFCCWGSRMLLDNTRIYNLWWAFGLSIYDFSFDGSNVVFSTEVGSYPPSIAPWVGQHSALEKYGSYLYTAASDANNFVVWDVSNPASIPPGTLVTIGPGETGLTMGVNNGRLYVNTASGNRLHIYSLANPASPSLLNSIDGLDANGMSFTQNNFFFKDTLVAVPSSTLPGIKIYNETASGLEPKGSIVLSSSALSAQFVDHVLFVSTSTELSSYDVSDPINPVFLASVAQTIQPFSSDLKCSLTKGVCLTSAGNNDPNINVFKLDSFK